MVGVRNSKGVGVDSVVLGVGVEFFGHGGLIVGADYSYTPLYIRIRRPNMAR
jgi:hypothetical protein